MIHRYFYLLVIGFMLFLGNVSYAQDSVYQDIEWTKTRFLPNWDFHEIQQAFRDHWDGETGPGWKQFKRWEYFMEPRVGPDGKGFRSTQTWRVVQQQTPKVGRSQNGNWTYIGADNVPNNGGAGRINTVAFDPNNPSTIYAGSASGGFWKSTDGGMNWITTTDNLPVIGVTDITPHPTNSNILYMATGDGDGWDTYSIGVVKSMDGGNSWDTTGLSFAVDDYIVTNSLIINPNNPSVLLAATDNGLYKTSDGADNWTKVKAGHFLDLEFKPGDPSIIYASGYAGSGYWEGKFFRSIDGGDNFSAINSGYPNDSSLGRVEIGVTPADPSYVYFVAGHSFDHNFYGLYRSTNSGQDFTEMSTSPNILGYSTSGSGSSGQSWYDLAIAVSPTDKNTVFTGGINVWRSLDGGNSWDCQTHWYGANGTPYIHADIHGLKFNANGTLFASNDGGVFKTADNGATWSDISDKMHIGQVYRLNSSVLDPSRVISGWQDNGTNLNAFSTWERVIGGDGMECIIDPTNSSIMYGSIQNGEIEKSTDGGSSFSSLVGKYGSGVHEDGAWVTPYVINPNNPQELLVAKSMVYRTTDGGNTWNPLGSLPGAFGDMKSLALAPSNNNYIYVTSGDDLWVSTDGYTFMDRTDSNWPFLSDITSIEIDETDPAKAWITFSGYDGTEKVYKTTDAGQTWVNISNGFPDIPANTVVHEHGTSDALYVGTDVGVYYRDGNMSSWQPFSSGLPNVIVNELEINPTSDKLIAATYGRGIWESDLHGIATSLMPKSGSFPSIKVYPNPAPGKAKIVLSRSPEQSVRVMVKDPLGRTVKTKKGRSGQTRFAIDFSAMEKGTYFVYTIIGKREFVNKVTNVGRD